MELARIERDKEISVFNRLFTDYEGTKNQILYYYGVSGIGRTFLKEMMEQEISNLQNPFRYVDIDGANDALNRSSSDLKLLLYLRKQLRSTGVKFRLFDLAYPHFYKTTRLHPSGDSKAEISHYEKFEFFATVIEILRELFDLRENFDKLNDFRQLLISTYNAQPAELSTLENTAKFLLVSIGSLIKVISVIKKYAPKKSNLTTEEFAELNEYSKLDVENFIDLRRDLLAFFAEDVDNHYKSIRDEAKISVFLDNYEVFSVRNSSGKISAESTWLHDLMRLSPNILWILFGIENYEMSAPELTLKPETKSLSTVSHPITLLERDQILQGMEHMELREEIREYIATESCGIPWVADTLIKRYLENEEKGRLGLNFLKLSKEDHKIIVNRYADFRYKGNTRSTLEILAVAGSWDEYIFQYLMDEYRSYPSYHHKTLADEFSFIYFEEGRYFMHERLRQSLLALTDPRQIDRVKRSLQRLSWQ